MKYGILHVWSDGRITYTPNPSELFLHPGKHHDTITWTTNFAPVELTFLQLPDINRLTKAGPVNLGPVGPGGSIPNVPAATLLSHASDLDQGGPLGDILRVTQLNGVGPPPGGTGSRNFTTIHGGHVTAHFQGGQLTSFTYTAPRNFIGTDFFSYTVKSNDNGTDVVTGRRPCDPPAMNWIFIPIKPPRGKQIFLT
jgi:hypothetical protein